MEKKKWYMSRTVWSGIVMVLIAAYNSASEQFGLPQCPDFVYGILSALGIHGRVSATKAIG